MPAQKRKGVKTTKSNLPSRGSMNSNSSGGSNNPSLSKKPSKKKQKTDKRKRDWLQDCQELYGDQDNALKVLEEQAGIHYKPLIKTTLKCFEEIKDAYLVWAGFMFRKDPETVAKRLRFGAPFPDVKDIKTFYALAAKKGKSRLGATGMSHKSLKTFHRQFLSMVLFQWYRNTGERVPDKDAEQLLNHATGESQHFTIIKGSVLGQWLRGMGMRHVFFWFISNSEGGPEVQVVLQWEFNKNMHLSEAKRTSSNMSTLSIEQVDMDGVLSLLALADHYSVCEEKLIELFEHPEKITKFPYKVEVKKDMASQPVFCLIDEKTPATYNTVNNTLRRLGRQLGWPRHTMNSEHGKTTYQTMYHGVNLSALRFGHTSDTRVMRLMSSVSQGKRPISDSTDRVISMLEADIEMHSLIEAHAKALEAISAKYPSYSYDPHTIETGILSFRLNKNYGLTFWLIISKSLTSIPSSSIKPTLDDCASIIHNTLEELSAKPPLYHLVHMDPKHGRLRALRYYRALLQWEESMKKLICPFCNTSQKKSSWVKHLHCCEENQSPGHVRCALCNVLVAIEDPSESDTALPENFCLGDPHFAACFETWYSRVISGLDMKTIDMEEAEAADDGNEGRPFKWDHGVNNCIANTIGTTIYMCPICLFNADLPWPKRLYYSEDEKPIMCHIIGHMHRSQNDSRFRAAGSFTCPFTDCPLLLKGVVNRSCIAQRQQVLLGVLKQREVREQRGQEAGAKWVKQRGEMS
ncbi:hypothetical protein SCLCIDRAFT_7139 [Scleroderma citrinum Foug A]|uniref:Uncharacterized protein n=1 Tax=Scleroderma citrinum Foug A TaxID=1036808 RepID=A0A0C3EM10_9AGAM|nr:hypothetical protein SCLCIDRAFT_7139 [Scleroderma citrinum Foug A]